MKIGFWKTLSKNIMLKHQLDYLDISLILESSLVVLIIIINTI